MESQSTPARLDGLLAPFTALSCRWLKKIRHEGVQHYPKSMRIFTKIGLFPIEDHYYEPRFRFDDVDFEAERSLPGLDFRIPEQLALLKGLERAKELEDVPKDLTGDMDYYWHNPAFGPGDAEILYGFVRMRKPKRFLEIGSGHSTLMVHRAIQKNREENPDNTTEHICIEPYEQPWLEQLGPVIHRIPVERMSIAIFEELEAGDILFIDSSHILRPDGDVLFLFSEVLPVLKPGVLIHIHDVFTPWHYPRERLETEVMFWNEQYFLEVFLTQNSTFRIVCALHLLTRKHAAEFETCCPVYARKEYPWVPGSFWIESLASY